jgi:DNA ligase-4
MESSTLRELQTIAFEAVGREARDAARYKDVDEWGRELWGKRGDGVDEQRKELKRRRTAASWEEKLENIDRARSEKRRKEDLEMSL